MELSVQEAAERLGISEATVRRRIHKGKLHAVKRPIPTGYEWRVIIGEQQPVTSIDQGVTSVDHGVIIGEQPREPQQRATYTPDDQSTVSHADQDVVTADQDLTTTNSVPYAAFERVLDDNRRLQSENMQLAGQLGFVQAQLQQAQERIKLLEAPKEEPAPEPEPEPEPTPARDDRPWWERLRSRLRRT